MQVQNHMSWRSFALGVIVALVVIVCAGYIFVARGGVPMATTARPLPFEQRVARLALRASTRDARDTHDPLAVTTDNLLAGAAAYRDHCAFCHGMPGHGPDATAPAMFPKPPELFTSRGTVAGDPEGITHWKVTNGIRLSAMPAFGQILSDNQRWQVTMLLAHADTLPPQVESALTQQH